MSAVKAVTKGLFVLVAVALVALLFFLVSLDDIVKRVIETEGSKLTGTAVTVAQVEIDLSSGAGRLTDFSIANPDDYSDAALFKVGTIGLQLKASSMTGPVLLIQQLVIDGAAIEVEQKGEKTNVQALLDQMESGEKAKAPAPGEPPPPSGAEPRLAMTRLSFTGASARLTAQTGDQRDMKIPDFEMRNIGDPAVGLTPEQFGNAIVREVLSHIEKAAAKELRKAAEKQLKKELEERLDDDEKRALGGLQSLIGKDEDKDKD